SALRGKRSPAASAASSCRCNTRKRPAATPPVTSVSARILSPYGSTRSGSGGCGRGKPSVSDFRRGRCTSSTQGAGIACEAVRGCGPCWRGEERPQGRKKDASKHHGGTCRRTHAGGGPSGPGRGTDRLPRLVVEFGSG